VIEAIENHQFLPVRKLHWRNARLEFGTAQRLIDSLELPTRDEWLTRVRESDDLAALKALVAMPEVAGLLRDARDVRLLWDICRVPDFRGHSQQDHATLLARLFGFVHNGGRIPTDWLSRNIARIDRTEGDIDMLSRRLAFIRTWTYVAQRPGWVDDENHWRGETRAVEDRLSDALHARLTATFVDRRTSVLMRRLNQKESLVAEVNEKGEVTVEGEFVGRLEGFRFRQDKTASADEARTLRQAAIAALAPAWHLRADRFYNAPDGEMDFTEQGGLMWGSEAVGKLIPGSDAMRPQVQPFVDEEAGAEVVEKVRRRLQHFIDRKVAALFEPLENMQRDETLTGLARGFAFRLVEALGVIPREAVAEEVKALDQEARGMLRKHGVRFGQYTVFLPALLKPAPTRLRLVLWSLAERLDTFPESPPPGLVTIPNIADVPLQHYTLSGYRPAGARAVRIDMLERLADLLRTRDARAGFEAAPEMLSITGMTLEQFADLMQGLGYGAERGERARQKPATPQELTAEAVAEAAAREAARPFAPREEEGLQPPATDAAAAEAAAGDAVTAPADDPAALTDASAETEVFYTFRWQPRARPRTAPRRDGGQRREGGGPRRAPATPVDGAVADAVGAPAPDADSGAADRPDRARGGGKRGRDDQRSREERGAGKPHGKPQGAKPGREDARGGSGKRPQRADGKPGGKPHGKPDGAGAQRQFSAGPERRRDRIDPDNPFAAALMGLRDKT
jgi:ATP-dependent RNA helicase SUPV3L1/SUV3